MSAAGTLTLTDFLLARIAEDEAAADRVEFHPYVGDGVPWDLKDRVLAECEAKRRIVEMYREHSHEAHADHRWSGFTGGYATATDHAVAILAAVYAYHPDYRKEWKV